MTCRQESLFLHSRLRRFSFTLFFCMASLVSMCTIARLLTSTNVIAGDRIRDSLKRLARSPLTKAPTSISSLGLMSPILTSQKQFRNCFSDSFGSCFTSNMSAICSCFGRFTANHCIKTWANVEKDVMEALGSLPNHLSAVPVSVSTNILHRMASLPPEISIYARNALRWASGSPSPKNGGTFGMMKCGAINSSIILLAKGCPSSWSIFLFNMA